MKSSPVISSWAAPTVRARFSRRASVLNSTSLMSELFPDPLTPVTAINERSGRLTSIFFRLFCRAPRIVKNSFAGNSNAARKSASVASIGTGFAGVLTEIRRLFGTGIDSLPDRYWPVSDAFDLSTCFGGPNAVISPPRSPAPGPKSKR